MADKFPKMRFRGKLRASQKDAARVIQSQLKAGESRLHIVAPPGSGKTVLGLYVWAELVRRPALVLSPNSAIQSQWLARTSMFDLKGHEHRMSDDPQAIGLLTSLTYQSVSLPHRGSEDLNAAAREQWLARLIETGQAQDAEEAAVWINDLRANNPQYFEQRLSAYRKHVRDALAMSGDAVATLHETSRQTLERLRKHDVGLIILDECHHLMGHWGRVLADAQDLLNGPVVLGLTATPPDMSGRDAADVERYRAFFGPVDFEVPIPALVRDGHLAPYQDLAYVIRPHPDELRFVADADERLSALIEELCEPRAMLDIEGDTEVAQSAAPPVDDADDQYAALPQRIAPLPVWIADALQYHCLASGRAKDWQSFVRRDRALADAGRLFLHMRKIDMPPGVPAVPPLLLAEERPAMEILVPVLDRYVRHGLRRSASAADHALAERVIARLRMLGVQITETGAQACASPVSRVLAYARGKVEAARAILKAEHAVLGDRMRAIVVTDFEKTSAVREAIADIHDEEAGGAIAAFKSLLYDPQTDALDPILVTGSTVLVDDELVSRFMPAARKWLAANGYDVQLLDEPAGGFHHITGRGADWCPRVYMRLITEMFQHGMTRCLIGTRGLLGEGWDANRVNVLVDLTTVTTSMSVNQLRGRSMRLDPKDKHKVSDNWDVICVAGEFAKGLDDYHRFIARHQSLYGVTDDGEIERGVGHVHAAFTNLKPEGVEGAMHLLNAEMLARSKKRKEARTQWSIGTPFHGLELQTLEVKRRGGGGGGFPPMAGAREPWSDTSLVLAMSTAVLSSLRETEQIAPDAKVRAKQRAGGYVRAFLRSGSDQDSALFTTCMAELLGPLDRPRYVIPRYVDRDEDTWLSRIMPHIVKRYFRKRLRHHAMLHAVPGALARNKDRALVFQKYWNELVSPGEAVYAYHGEGERLMLEAIQRGQTPNNVLHEKGVFL